jgi:ELWxxDGT repeat protein
VSVAVLACAAFGTGLAVGNSAPSRPSLFTAAPVGVRVIEEGPSGFALVGDVMLFAAKTDAEGRELWRTDGTRGGTRLVRDISPGERSSNPLGVPLGDVFVFAARDGRHGEELWRSDGTRRGTFLLEDIKPHGQNAGDWSFSTATDDGRVFFTADDGRHGEELWVTDGTKRGTHLVRDIDRTPGDRPGITISPGSSRSSVSECSSQLPMASTASSSGCPTAPGWARGWSQTSTRGHRPATSEIGCPG